MYLDIYGNARITTHIQKYTHAPTNQNKKQNTQKIRILFYVIRSQSDYTITKLWCELKLVEIRSHPMNDDSAFKAQAQHFKTKTGSTMAWKE